MFGGIIFFGFLAAIIIVPQVLRNQERQRLHDTIRASLAKGQPVPPALWQALSWRRRVYTDDVGFDPNLYAAQPAPAARPYSAEQARAAAGDPVIGDPLAGDPLAGGARRVEPGMADPYVTPAPPPLFVGRSLVERDLRRGVVWLAIGIGLIAAGAAFYAGLYYDGGAPEVFSSFAALGAIPAFIGLTYLALWFFSRKSKV